MYSIEEQEELQNKIGKLFFVPLLMSYRWDTFQDHGKWYLYTADSGRACEIANQYFIFGSFKPIGGYEYVSSLISKNKTIWTFSPGLFLRNCTQITF